MINPHEDELRASSIAPGGESAATSAPAFDSAELSSATPSPYDADSTAPAPTPPAHEYPPSPAAEAPLFAFYTQPPARRPVRIPHFGHLLLLSLLILVALGIVALGLGIASYFHLFGLKLSTASATDLRLNLLSEAALYFIAFGFCLFVFPKLWDKGYFAGVQWRGEVARSKFWILAGIALTCFGLAILDEAVMPGPTNAPIDKMISSPGAAWLMFVFGVTVAPFFEEMFFRGFLLPALCTACDWAAETIRHTQPRPLDTNDHPRWSLPAVIVGSLVTSVAFAGLHAAQQGHSLGPFLLLIAISLVLCAVRLITRSLAASTLVHAYYNFFIFATTLAATGGFRHFDKM